jgi:hypothetical protein
MAYDEPNDGVYHWIQLAGSIVLLEESKRW